MEGEAEDFVIDEDGNLCPVADWDEDEEVEEEVITAMVINEEAAMQLFHIPRAEIPALRIALKTLLTALLTPQ